jgi:hypothetical protein
MTIQRYSLYLGLGLAKARDAVALFPLSAFLEDFNALEAFHYVALAAQSGRCAETTMLCHKIFLLGRPYGGRMVYHEFSHLQMMKFCLLVDEVVCASRRELINCARGFATEMPQMRVDHLQPPQSSLRALRGKAA